mmetsp:Transcript_76570/g.68652  ORF Transcript_76570/g.68652 Transcript_76570/m.68652 type:complete len:229 (-) Transcript_76570:263-949(-)
MGDQKEDYEIESHTMKHPLVILLCISKYEDDEYGPLPSVATDLKLLKSLWLDLFKYDENYVSVVNEIADKKGHLKKSAITKHLNNICAALQLGKYPKADGLIFIYSGHGEADDQNRNGIVSSDEKLMLIRDIQKKFDSKHCDFLKKKPKLFYMDCCRGEKEMKQKNIELVKGNDNVGQRYVNPLSDFYIHMATSQGYVAFCKSKKRRKLYDQCIIFMFKTSISKKENG